MKNILIFLVVFLLFINIVSAASCIDYAVVSFGLKPSYAVNSDITFAPVISSSKDLSDKAILIELQQEDEFTANKFETVDQQQVNIGSDNTLPEITFDGVLRSSDIKIKLTIYDDALPNKEVSYNSSAVPIKQGISIKPSMSSTLIEDAGQDIIIDLDIEDEAGVDITSPVSVGTKINLGTKSIPSSNIKSSPTKVTFNTKGMSLVYPVNGKAVITASASGYASDTEEFSFSLIQAGISYSIKVDGIDYNSLDGGRITVGTHTISLSVKQGASLIKIDKLLLTMTDQSGVSGQQNLIFTKNTDGTIWTGSYNFKNQDVTYTLEGTATNFATNKEYKFTKDTGIDFNTLVGGEDRTPCEINPSLPECRKEGISIWVWVIIAVVIIGVGIGIYFGLIRRRK